MSSIIISFGLLFYIVIHLVQNKGSLLYSSHDKKLHL